jgi:hypothetical protein
MSLSEVANYFTMEKSLLSPKSIGSKERDALIAMSESDQVDEMGLRVDLHSHSIDHIPLQPNDHHQMSSSSPRDEVRIDGDAAESDLLSISSRIDDDDKRNVEEPPPIRTPLHNIQAEAMLELQKLRDRLDTAKKDFEVTKDADALVAVGNEKPALSIRASNVAVVAHGHQASTSYADGGLEKAKAVDAYVFEQVATGKAKSVDRADEKDVDWVDLYSRAHVLQRSGPWVCLYDTAHNRMFFRNQDTGMFQFNKPDEIGEIRDAPVYPMPKSILNKPANKSTESRVTSVAASVPNTADVVAKPSGVGSQGLAVKLEQTSEMSIPLTISSSKTVSKANDVAVNSAISIAKVTALSSSPDKTCPKPSAWRPSTENKSAKPHSETRSSFVTMVHLDDPQSPEVNRIEDTYRAVDVDMSKELAFVEKAAAKEFHEFLQRDYQNQEDESQMLLNRLQALAVERQTDAYMTGNAGAGRVSNQHQSIASLDRDQLRRVHSRARELMKKCCMILEQVEVSPIEHLINEQHLLKAAVHQRNYLSNPADPLHEGPAYDFLPTTRWFPCYKPLQTYWRNRQAGHALGNNWVMFVDEPRDSLKPGGQSKRWYWHATSGIVQRGEPFDVMIKRRKAVLKREVW